MKKNLLFAFLMTFAVITGTLTGCSKDEESTPAPTKTQLLTSSAWKLANLTVSPALSLDGDPATTDMFSLMDECEKDGRYTYAAANNTATSGSLTNDEGATKCDPSDPQTVGGTWTFNSDQTQLTENTIQGGPNVTNIVELTNSTFKQSYVETISGNNYTFTATYSH